MHILTRIPVVDVGQLRHILYPFVCLLQAGHHDRHVSGRSKVLAVLILEIFLLDIEEKASVVGSEVGDSESVVSVSIVFDDIGRVWPGVAKTAGRGDEVGVHKPYFVLLEDGVEQFEDLFAQQLVVAVEHYKDILRVTESVGC